jgi:hypothetical protein
VPPGAVRVAGCQALRLRATRITGISGDDTVSVRKASGAAVTVTGPSALTVSSSTEPGTGRPAATGTLAMNDADPALRAHKESRLTLTSAGSSVQLVWRKLGLVAWSGSAASFPAAPNEPGIYLIKVTLDDRYRIYIGEAEDLSRRLRRYGGQADEKPNQAAIVTAAVVRDRGVVGAGQAGDRVEVRLPRS